MGLRWMTAGESHGPGLVGIIAGLPAGLEIWPGRIDAELLRRQGGAGRSTRQQIERDTATIIAGVRHGKTIGSPVAIIIENKDHQNWESQMSSDPVEDDPDFPRAYPRPGHADLAGMIKWGFDDARNVLERASGRTTAITVALGAVCKMYLEQHGIYTGSRIIEYGGARILDKDESIVPTRDDIGDDPSTLASLHNLSAAQQKIIEELVEKARDTGDTLGGVVQSVSAHVPPGLGSYALPDERLDSRIAAAAMGIPGVKAVEIGAGITQAGMGGKTAHDQFALTNDSSHQPWYGRSSNLAGGIEGGVTNGEPVSVTAWMKPLATVNPPLPSIDPRTKEPVQPESSERSDVAAVEAMGVVLEAVVAMELAKALLEK
jgi:chorismate synthase